MSMSLTDQPFIAGMAQRLGLFPLLPMPDATALSSLDGDPSTGDSTVEAIAPQDGDNVFAASPEAAPQAPADAPRTGLTTPLPQQNTTVTVAAGSATAANGTVLVDNVPPNTDLAPVTAGSAEASAGSAPSPTVAGAAAAAASMWIKYLPSNTRNNSSSGTTGASLGTQGSAGAIAVIAGSVVAKAGQTVALSSLFSVGASAANPTYLILSGLDREEYTAGTTTATMGTLSGNGTTQTFKDIDGDAYSVGVVFTYQAATGRYYNASYGYFDQTTFTAGTNTNDNVSLSVFTTNSAAMANANATNPYTLSNDSPASFGYVGSVSVVTQPSFNGPAPSQATPDSICSVATTFVGKAWNDNGCWVLASNISAEAGASLPLTSTSIGIPGAASGEWVVAYDGPVSASNNWESQVTAGEIIAFETTSGGGHITTVVSGSGSSALLVDNITYLSNSGAITNLANDGSANDVTIAAPHAATQEFNGVDPSMVVVYELDTPVVSDLVSSVAIGEKATQALSPLFAAANPLAAQAVTEWQVYDTDTSDTLTVSGALNATSHSVATAVTVSSLANVALLAGATTGSDTIEVRAYNGSYWGDWQSLTATITAPLTAPAITAQTAAQTWQQGQKVSLTLAANTFTDPQGQSLTYAATLSNGQALPSWLSFNATTRTFSGTVPAGIEALSLMVTATDTGGLSTSETFGVTVPAAAPTLTSQTAGQTWVQGATVSFTLPANTFTDPQGQTLTYGAALSNGQALPSWLSFNGTTDTLSGIVPANAAGLSITITAKDSSGLSAAETFTVATPASLKAPTLATQTATQTWLQGSRVTFTLAANSFSDPQGQALTYSASLASGQPLPSWLSFNAKTETFSGIVPAGMESLSLKVTATDTSGLSGSETFGVTVPAAAPILTNPTATQIWQQGSTVSFALPTNTFTDPQGQTLTYGATLSNGQALPSWLSFNANTDSFSGTVPSSNTTLSITVTAKDSSGLSATDTFGVLIPAAAPVVALQTPSQTWTDGQKISFVLPAGTFVDPQGQAMTYTAYQVLSPGAPLVSSWLNFNAKTGTFSGTVPGGASGTLALEVIARDSGGLTATDLFNVTLKGAGSNAVSGAIVALVPKQSTGLGQLASNG